MPSVSQAQRGAMAAAAAGKSNIGIPKSVGQEFMAADKGGKLPARKEKPVKKYAKGGYVFDNPDRARGGPPVTQHSQFMKTPDPFRTSIEEQDYPKKQADAPVKSKSLKPVVPRG